MIYFDSTGFQSSRCTAAKTGSVTTALQRWSEALKAAQSVTRVPQTPGAGSQTHTATSPPLRSLQPIQSLQLPTQQPD